MRGREREGEAIKCYLIAHKFEKSSGKILVNAGIAEGEGREGTKTAVKEFFIAIL